MTGPQFFLCICQGWSQAGSQGEKGRGAGEQTRVEGQPGDHDGTLTKATVQDGLSQVAACLGVSPGSFVGREFVISMKEKVSTACLPL